VDCAGAALLGLLLGAITGLPIGVVNLAIADAATRGEDRFARGIALGGGLADGIHGAIAFIGVGRLLAARPHWTQAMAIAAALVIAIYAIAGRRPSSATTSRHPSSTGFATGLLFTLPNPAALGAWVAVAASVWPRIELVPAIVLAAGVAAGSATWFTILAGFVTKLPPNGRARRVLPPLALVLLAAIAIAGVVRAFV
jgi:arginine exporter protein ArgO